MTLMDWSLQLQIFYAKCLNLLEESAKQNHMLKIFSTKKILLNWKCYQLTNCKQNSNFFCDQPGCSKKHNSESSFVCVDAPTCIRNSVFPTTHVAYVDSTFLVIKYIELSNKRRCDTNRIEKRKGFL